MPDDDLDPRVSASRQISLTRPPELASELARCYPHIDSEQDIIKQAMRDMVTQHKRGITPEQLLETFRLFVDQTGDIDAEIADDGDVLFQCERGELELENGEDSVDVSVSLEDREE